jgi:diguanylate cyclase (GGDEF)-like protein
MTFAIICVDDDPIVLASLGEQLGRSFGQDHIELASSASESLKLFSELKAEGIEIPVIISDQKMPGISGDQLLTQVHLAYPNTLTILLTGQSSVEDVAKAVNSANLYRYIAKPWDETDLLLTIKEAVLCYFQEQEIVAQRSALSQGNELLRATLEATADGILVVNNEGEITHYNQKTVELWSLEHQSGWLDAERERSVSTNQRMLTEMVDRLENPAVFVRQIRYWHQPFSLDNSVVLKLKNGKAIVCYSQAQRLGGENLGRVWSFHDISEKIAHEEAIYYQTHYDDLTGLSNRNHISHQLSQLLAHAVSHQEQLAILLIDLDHFHDVNENLGHGIGDRLLQQVVHRLKQCCCPGDLLGRWGDDKFAIVLPHLTNRKACRNMTQRIFDALSPNFEIDEHHIFISCSIGIAVYPEDGVDPVTLLKNVDMALHQAKKQGHNDYQFYDPDFTYQTRDSLVLENSFYQALEREEFSIYYQPQVNTTTGEITHMEATLCWQHPELGFIAPEVFIPIAERKGLILRLGQWLLHRACIQAATWQSIGSKPIVVTVNLFSQHFWHRELLPSIQQILTQTGLPPQYLELEIPETLIMNNVALARKILLNVQNMGIKIALDNFGTGYSSLRYLKQFPFDTLKIDRSFISDLESDSYYMAIADTLLTLGRRLQIRVVAEGVETIEVKNLLHTLQCQYMQGHWFNHPLPLQQATQVLLVNAWTFATRP